MFDQAAAGQLATDGGADLIRGVARNGTRWSVALALGLRQGEALGLRWRYIDLEAGLLTVRWQLQRLPWHHGCADPHTCGEGRHRADCPRDCTRHARSCPQ